MESKESSSTTVPPGFRFHPTDEELVGYYLRKKIASQKIDLDVIRDIDLYRIEPWDLRERCRIGYEEQSEWYFFSHKDKKYPTGTRTNRATMAGFWKATGRDKAVFEKSRLIGMRKTLVFYRGRAPNGQKTEWIMHEYRLESDVNGCPQEEGWVVCRAFQKRTNVQSSKNMETWATSNYFLDEIASSAMADPQNTTGFFTTQSFAICKQETPLQFSDPFAQLPHLESPNSLPPTTSSSQNTSNSKKNANAVTDWRTLDKFVASQLMSRQDDDDGEDANAVSDSLLCGGEEENKFVSGFLNQSSDCDFGICLFDK